MSSENESDSLNGDTKRINNDRVCRDFLRNVCHRGEYCKYRHTSKQTNDSTGGKVEYVFCHDYQNSKCSRINCRFIHCTQDEEEYYKATGGLPHHVLDSLLRNGMALNFLPGRPGEAPVCKDYLKGECRRGGKCKFRHISVWEYEREISYTTRSPPRPTTGTATISRRRDGFDYEDHFGIVDQFDDLGPTEVKRRLRNSDIQLNHRPISIGENYFVPNGHFFSTTPSGSHVLSHAEARTLMLEDENLMLRKKVEVLKKQVSDLTATNEFLLDQNAQFRMGGKRTTNVTSVTVPAVTITNTGASTMQVQPMTAQIQPAQAPTPQQMVNAAVAAGALRTVTASVTTVPVSIAAVAGAPVSIATVSMAPVQIPPPVVTMAQQTLTVEGPQPPQQGQQQNQQQPPLPMSMSGPTAPMVSYPIMTQELRPVLQSNLSH